MAYTALATAVTGDLWTAANHNTYIKDNFAAGVPDIFTAAGDIAYATADNTAAALAIGDPSRVLSVNSSGDAPEWEYGVAGCCLEVTTDMDITGTGEQKVVFDTEVYDTGSLWSSSDSDAVIIPWDGVYQCSGRVQFEAGNAANEFVYIGGEVVGYITSATALPGAISFCYTKRFEAGNDVYLSVKTGVASIDLQRATYSVTYLGAST